MSTIDVRRPRGGYRRAPEPRPAPLPAVLAAPADHGVSLRTATPLAPEPEALPQTPIVPPQSISGRALIAVIAIMSLLATLTLGVVVVVRGAAAEWQMQVAREMTIQVRPTAGRDTAAEVERAATIARATPGIASVTVFTEAESARLLEPWLGTGLSLNELPMPRMLVVTVAPGEMPDLALLRRNLADGVVGASLDDHRGWVERMRKMTRAIMVAGIGVLGLVLAATVLLVTFATRGAMAANRHIVEVLHFVGAKNRYIAGQFQRHFLRLGLQGAGLGGGLAVVAFAAAGYLAPHDRLITGEDPVAAMFGNLALPPEGYAGMAGLIVLVAAVTAITSRWTVHRTLGALG